MSRLRRTIALRLKESQNTAAQLTTFNEVDMSHVIALRAEYKESFEKKHGVRLGFMGFFVKACIAALKELPNVNGEIEGNDIIYKNYFDIGVAVSTERGLVVPVVRDADKLSLAQIEAKIHDYGLRARDNKLKLDELLGGTFTITNGACSAPCSRPRSSTRRSPASSACTRSSRDRSPSATRSRCGR